MAEFDFDTIKSLNFPEQKEYVKKFFIPLKSGDHVVLGDNS